MLFGTPYSIPSFRAYNFGIPLSQWKLAIMGTKAVRLNQKQIEHAKPKEKDYVLSDGDGLQLRIYIELCGRYLAFTRKAHLPTDS